jgi:CBS domain containing-hemolysin-like protein
MEPGLERAWEMTDQLEIYLTSCQVGITASSIAVGTVAESALAAIFAPVFGDMILASVGGGALLAFLIINLLHLTHGEQTPTYLGVERSKFVCRYGATPLYYFAKSISPLIKLGDGIAKWTLSLFGVEMTGAWLETETDAIETRGDLHRELSSTLAESGLSEERRQEVMNALVVGDVPIRGNHGATRGDRRAVDDRFGRGDPRDHRRLPPFALPIGRRGDRGLPGDYLPPVDR